MNICKNSAHLCGHDPECPDLLCEGRPMTLHRVPLPITHDREEKPSYSAWAWFGAAVFIAVFAYLFCAAGAMP